MGRGSLLACHWQELEVSWCSCLFRSLTLMFFCSVQVPPESTWTCTPNKPARPPEPSPPISIQPTPSQGSVSHLGPRYFTQHQFWQQNLGFPFSRCYLLCPKWPFRHMRHAQTTYTINSKLATGSTASWLHFYWKGSRIGWNVRLACCTSSSIPILYLPWYPLPLCARSMVRHHWWCPM